MSGAERLLRWYRRLLHAYPRWYRRERGTEMLTTLLDAAPPGRHRPTRGDVADLLRAGLRCRLRPPRGAGYRLVAGLVALFAALGGLAAAGLLSAPGAPTGAQVAAAAAAVLPQRPPHVVGPAEPCTWCPDRAYGGVRRSDLVAVAYHPRSDEVAALMADARARLAAAGWRVDPVTVDEDSLDLTFTADKDGTTVRLTGSTGQAFVDKDLSRPDPSFVPVRLVVTRSFPTGAAVALAAGFLGGALVGWLVTAWVLQCFRRHRPAVRAALLGTGLPVLLVAGTLDSYAAQWSLGLTFVHGWSPTAVMAPAALAAATPRWLVAAAVAAALAPVAVAALPARAGTRRAAAVPAR